MLPSLSLLIHTPHPRFYTLSLHDALPILACIAARGRDAPDVAVSEAILPGATIGILGGGQLGRMTGMAARSLGYDVHVLDPDPHCPASAIASRTVTARFDDADAAASLAERCAVVTLEIEQIGTAALAAVGARAPLRPSAAAVHIIQDRIRQKGWLDEHGFPVGEFRAASSREESVAAFEALGRSIVKSTSGGYDGRGQVRVGSSAATADAWVALGEQPCLIEQFLDIHT